MKSLSNCFVALLVLVGWISVGIAAPIDDLINGASRREPSNSMRHRR